MESKDIVDICPTKTVYALCIITNDTHHLALLSNLVDNGLLGKVGVLILINKHIFKFLGILTSHLIVIGKEEVDIQ